MQPDEVFSIRMRLVAIEDLLAGKGVQVTGQTLLGILWENDLLGSQLVVNLLGGEAVSVEGGAGPHTQDEESDDLQDHDTPANCACHDNDLL
jgi:hypothetical protein